jgi:hypothetical protein
MRRFIPLFVLFAVMAMASTASASEVEGKATGGVAFAQGSEQYALHLAFNAQIGPHGDATGNVNVQSPDFAPFDVMGKVACYYQSGNTAWFSGPIVGGDSTYGYFLIGVTDNGEPGTEGTPDMVRIRVTNSASQAACHPVSGGFPIDNPITGGNLQVHE